MRVERGDKLLLHQEITINNNLSQFTLSSLSLPKFMLRYEKCYLTCLLTLWNYEIPKSEIARWIHQPHKNIIFKFIGIKEFYMAMQTLCLESPVLNADAIVREVTRNTSR